MLMMLLDMDVIIYYFMEGVNNMRMWMADVTKMCDKHLLGEHVELHMFIGTLRKDISLKGYKDNNLVEPLSIPDRHTQITEEMKRRGMKHNSEISEGEFHELLLRMPKDVRNNKINKKEALEELLIRCDRCQKNFWPIKGV